MKIEPLKLSTLLLILLVSFPTYADWLDSLKGLLKKDDSSSTMTDTVAALTNDEMIAGLKEALAKGTKTAVGYLGKEGGFLDNAEVKIPMPASLTKVESGLRRIGQDKYADTFIETMNRAAESAVPVAADVFSDSIKQMSIDDAKNILSGPDDAATEYFKSTSSDTLKEKFLPIVKTATDKVGLTSTYKNMVGKLGPLSGFIDTSSLDLDGYVTDKALEGLFLVVAQEEQKIRQDPVARTTDLLKKVFGR